MTNPFIGSDYSVGDRKIRNETDFDSLPLELTEEFETRVFPSVAAPKVRQNNLPRSSICLVVRGNKPNNILVKSERPRKSTMAEFKSEWVSHLKTERTEKIIEKTPDIFEVPKGMRASYISSLEGQIKDFTQFIVTDLSPIANGFETAIDHAEQLLRLITKSDQDMSQAGVLRAMLRDSMQLKALQFISEKLDLSADQKSVLVEKYFKPRDVHVHPQVTPSYPGNQNNSTSKDKGKSA